MKRCARANPGSSGKKAHPRQPQSRAGWYRGRVSCWDSGYTHQDSMRDLIMPWDRVTQFFYALAPVQPESWRKGEGQIGKHLTHAHRGKKSLRRPARYKREFQQQYLRCFCFRCAGSGDKRGATCYQSASFSLVRVLLSLELFRCLRTLPESLTSRT